MKKGDLVKVRYLDGLFVYMGVGVLEGWSRVCCFKGSKIILVRQSSIEVLNEKR